jgi:hypothetical protein
MGLTIVALTFGQRQLGLGLRHPDMDMRVEYCGPDQRGFRFATTPRATKSELCAIIWHRMM